MEHEYDNLSISFLDGNNITYKDIGTGDQNTFDELKKVIAGMRAGPLMLLAKKTSHI